MINSWDLSLFYVLVFDDSGVPRCCCVYLTQIPDKLPLLEHLRNWCVRIHAPAWRDFAMYGTISQCEWSAHTGTNLHCMEDF